MCDDTGWRLKPHGNVERAVRCGCQRTADLLRGIPKEYRAAELTGFHKVAEDAARAWLKQLLSNLPVSLLLSGPTGTGKTWLAVALLKEARRAAMEVTFIDTDRFYLKIRQAQALDEPPEGVRELYTRAPVLVLDDIGAGSDSEFERRELFQLVSNRLSHGLPTIATTNRTMDQIAEQIDDRLASRLARYEQIEFPKGRDRRLRTVER